MASEFIEIKQKLEKTACFIPKMGLSFIYDAMSRIKTISDFINRYADMGVNNQTSQRSVIKSFQAGGNDDTG